MRRLSFVVAAVIALAAPQCANAAMKVTGDLGFNYTRASDSINAFGGNGDALITFGKPGLGLQFGAGDEWASGGGSSNAWIASSDLFWRDNKGTFGVSVGRAPFGLDVNSKDITSYGAFGEWYASRNLSLSFKGGAFSGLGGGLGSGEYGGLGLEWYLSQNYGLKTGYTYISASGLTASRINLGIEVALSRSMPISLATGFSYTKFSGYTVTTPTPPFFTITTLSAEKIFGIALHYRFGQRGSLVSTDRTGPIKWDGTLSYLSL